MLRQFRSQRSYFSSSPDFAWRNIDLVDGFCLLDTVSSGFEVGAISHVSYGFYEWYLVFSLRACTTKNLASIEFARFFVYLNLRFSLGAVLFQHIVMLFLNDFMIFLLFWI